MQETMKNLSDIRAHAESGSAMSKLSLLFDDMTFVQTGVFTKRNAFAGSVSADKNELDGVITGYGAVNGRLVYAYAGDSERMHGAIDENSAKKIEALYRLALANGAPVVALFDSAGANIYEGVSSMSAYSRILGCVSEASGVIPQIAVITGKCTGTMAAVAAMFDFTVETEKAQWYVTSPVLNGAKDAMASSVAKKGDDAGCFAYVRTLVCSLPSVCDSAAEDTEITDDPNRALPDDISDSGMRDMVCSMADAGSVTEVNADCGSVITCFASFGGVRCAVLATDASVNEGRIGSFDARKAARFVTFCDAYSLPLITLLDSKGVVTSAENEPLFAADLARLAQAYTESAIPMISVICKHAVGAAYILMGSKAVGADIVYSLPDAEIGTVEAKAAVAFAWNDRVRETPREELESTWKKGPASALSAATYGEVDDIIEPAELRARLCSALYMLRGSAMSAERRRPVYPM